MQFSTELLYFGSFLSWQHSYTKDGYGEPSNLILFIQYQNAFPLKYNPVDQDIINSLRPSASLWFLEHKVNMT